MLEIRLNGERSSVPAGLTVLTLLQHVNVKPDRVAVERNRQIVRPPEWESTRIEPGDEIEIVQFVGGG